MHVDELRIANSNKLNIKTRLMFPCNKLLVMIKVTVFLLYLHGSIGLVTFLIKYVQTHRLRQVNRTGWLVSGVSALFPQQIRKPPPLCIHLFSFKDCLEQLSYFYCPIFLFSQDVSVCSLASVSKPSPSLPNVSIVHYFPKEIRNQNNIFKTVAKTTFTFPQSKAARMTKSLL